MLSILLYLLPLLKTKSMKPSTFITVLSLAWAACNPPTNPQSAKADTIPAESQKINFARTFPKDNIAKVVSYSYLDVEEDDTTNRGQVLQIFPNFTEYANKNNKRPKVVLTAKETRDLLAIINDPRTYKFGAAFCYNPRNCFCFYNSKNEIVAWYEVCFECSRFESLPAVADPKKEIGLTQAATDKLEKLCQSAGIATQ
jgi:hypothetical protein